MAAYKYYKVTDGMREAITSGQLHDDQVNTVYLERADGLYLVDVSFSNSGKSITLEVFFCQPRDEIKNGGRVYDAVPCEIDTDIIYTELVEMYA